MSTEARELALMLKQRNNKSFEPLVLGRVISANPLRVSDGDDIVLDEELLATYNVQRLIRNGELLPGHLVCMITTSDYSKYVVIDKVV